VLCASESCQAAPEFNYDEDCDHIPFCGLITFPIVHCVTHPKRKVLGYDRSKFSDPACCKCFCQTMCSVPPIPLTVIFLTVAFAMLCASASLRIPIEPFRNMCPIPLSRPWLKLVKLSECCLG